MNGARTVRGRHLGRHHDAGKLAAGRPPSSPPGRCHLTAGGWMAVLRRCLDQRRSIEKSSTWVRQMLLPEGSRNDVSMPYGCGVGGSLKTTPRAKARYKKPGSRRFRGRAYLRPPWRPAGRAADAGPTALRGHWPGKGTLQDAGVSADPQAQFGHLGCGVVAGDRARMSRGSPRNSSPSAGSIMYLTPHPPRASRSGSSSAPASVRWNRVVATGGGASSRLIRPADSSSRMRSESRLAAIPGSRSGADILPDTRHPAAARLTAHTRIRPASEQQVQEVACGRRIGSANPSEGILPAQRLGSGPWSRPCRSGRGVGGTQRC